MIKYTKGDLLKSDCQILCNTVNCVSIMGKGIALQFKNKYPEMFHDYKNACRFSLIKPGGLWSWYDIPSGKIILNLATKDHWKNPSKLEWVKLCLDNVAKFLNQEDMGKYISIAIPRLGCGNGGLDWEVVKPLVEAKLCGVKQEVVVFEPY